MFTYERPDFRALEELQGLLQHLGEELAAWRRRCLKAEAELQQFQDAGGAGGPDLVQSRQRVVELEVENQRLRERIDAAKDRVRMIENRLAFVDQGSEDGAA